MIVLALGMPIKDQPYRICATTTLRYRISDRNSIPSASYTSNKLKPITHCIRVRFQVQAIKANLMSQPVEPPLREV